MTTPAERTRAVLQTQAFLQELTDPSLTPNLPSAIREEARRLLRHYPTRSAMRIANLACPNFFGPTEADQT